MAASVPLIVMPAMVTVLPLATFLSANVAVALLWFRLTVSPLSTPESAAEPFTSRAVAAIDAS